MREASVNYGGRHRAVVKTKADLSGQGLEEAVRFSKSKNMGGILAAPRFNMASLPIWPEADTFEQFPELVDSDEYHCFRG